MLSVLPPCEDAAWGPAGPCGGKPLLRKRPATCLGEYLSASGRAKRLREELLRLRQWEQQVHQESTGAREGQADSCDGAFAVEAPACASADLRPSICGAASCLEDACDSTASPVHGLPLAGASDACRCPHPSRLPDPALEQQPGSQATHATLERQAVSNPTQLRRTTALAAVQNGKTLSLPPRFSLAAASQPSTATPAAQNLAANPKHSGRRLVKGQGNPSGHGAAPLPGLLATSASECGSVQKSEPRRAQGPAGAPLGVVEDEEEEEEDSPREETSPPRPAFGARGGPWVAGQGPLTSTHAAAAGCLALPPLPRQYLGMPTATRLRLLEFFLQASEVLGLEVPSLYLAAVMLDCCWVEEGMRVKRAGSCADSVLSYEAEAGPVPSLSGEHLQVTALACLLYAFRCATTPSTSSAEAFVRRLSAGSSRCPRVAAMLPVRAAALEECLANLARRMPLEKANSATSAAGLLWTAVELRVGASQQQHLGLFVAHLCALGFQGLPSAVLAAASGCLATNDAPRGADQGPPNTVKRALGPGWQEKHLEVLHNFLCASKASGQACGMGAPEPCPLAEEQCLPEPSEEISI